MRLPFGTFYVFFLFKVLPPYVVAFFMFKYLSCAVYIRNLFIIGTAAPLIACRGCGMSGLLGQKTEQ